MAVAFDAAAENLDATSPGTVSVTVANVAGRVAIGFLFGSGSLGTTAATFAGNAMTKLGTATTAAGKTVTAFAIKGDASIPTGSQIFSATYTLSSATQGVGILVFNGADTAGTGWQNITTAGPTTSTAESITISSANGNMVCACGVDDDASGRTIGNGTSAFQETAGTGNYLASWRASSGASTNLSWTLGSSVSWASIGVDVIAAAGGAAFIAAQNRPLLQAVQRASYW
jgi:hypothetical protein